MTEALQFENSSQYTKFGVESIFTQKLPVNFPNNYKETANLEVET